jgi:hypothetical protein
MARFAFALAEVRPQAAQAPGRGGGAKHHHTLAAVLGIADVQRLTARVERHIAERERQHLTDPHARLTQDGQRQAEGLRHGGNRPINGEPVGVGADRLRQPTVAAWHFYHSGGVADAVIFTDRPGEQRSQCGQPPRGGARRDLLVEIGPQLGGADGGALDGQCQRSGLEIGAVGMQGARLEPPTDVRVAHESVEGVR